MKEEEFDEQVEEFEPTRSNWGTSAERKSGVLSYLNPRDASHYSPGEKIKKSTGKQEEYHSEKQKRRD